MKSPGSGVFPNRGPHSPNVGTHGKGGALAQPGRSVPMGKADGRLPIKNPPANVVGQKIGQSNPNTAAAATKKPNRKGGAAFYGEM